MKSKTNFVDTNLMHVLHRDVRYWNLVNLLLFSRAREVKKENKISDESESQFTLHKRVMKMYSKNDLRSK